MNEVSKILKNDVSEKWYSLEEIAELCGYASAHAIQSNSNLLELLNRFSNSNAVKFGGYHNTKKFYSEEVLRAVKEYQIRTSAPNALENKEAALSGNVSYIEHETVGKTIDCLLDNPNAVMLLLQKSLEKNQRLSFENKELKDVIEVQKPKVEFYDTVTKSESTFDMNEVAKLLKIPNMGSVKLFEFLREQDVLSDNKANWNEPYQNYVNAGYFKIVETKSEDRYGKVHVNKKTVVFQKGVDFIRKLAKDNRLVSVRSNTLF
jgi:phage antirepressor YoqD-like protein